MGSLLEMHKNVKTECPCCKTKIKKCPFCGSAGVILKGNESSVYCDNINCCDAEIDFGHWSGTEESIPAIHHVIAAWNTRASEEDE